MHWWDALVHSAKSLCMWPIWVRVWQVSATLPLQADFVFTANLGGGQQQVIQPVHSDRHCVQHGLAVRYVQPIDNVVGSQCALLGHAHTGLAEGTRVA